MREAYEAMRCASQQVTHSPLSFAGFDANMGVLTGISSALTFSGGLMTLSASGTLAAGNGQPSFASKGSVGLRSDLIGLSSFGAVNDTQSNSCSGNGAGSCFPTGVSNLSSNTSMTKTDSTWLNPTATVSPDSLNSYIGVGSVGSTVTATASVNLDSANRIADQQARLSVSGLTGSQSLTYSYLRHANASFAGGADTNSLALDLTGGASGFSVFNLGDSSTTKLDFVGLQCTGDCDKFDVSLASFQDLIAGNSISGTAALKAGVAGNYAAIYSLLFSDDTSVGAAASRLTNDMTLNVAAVPEPSTWALLSLGLISLALRRRKA